MLLAGNFAGALAGGLFFLAASHYLTLADMGLYAGAISVNWIASGMLGTGLGIGVVRLVADHLQNNERSRAAGILAGSELIILLVTILALFGWWLIADSKLVRNISLAPFMLWIIAWTGSRSFVEGLRAGLLAEQKYRDVSVFLSVGAIINLVALIILLVGFDPTLEGFLFAHVAGMTAFAVIGIVFLRALGKDGITLDRTLIRDLLHYARWPIFSESAKLLQIHLGPILLLSMAGAEAAGLFTLGRYPAFVFGIVLLSLYQYLLPEATHSPVNDQPHRLRELRLAALIGILMLIGAVLVYPLLPLLGTKFETAGPLFLINTLDFAIIVLIIPMEALFHGLHKPYLELISSLVRLIALFALAMWLIPVGGAIAMAWSHVISAIVAVLAAWWLLKRRSDLHSA